MPDSFHFLQPHWFFLLIPLAVILLFFMMSETGARDPWTKVIDKDLMPWLRVKSSGRGSRLPIWLLTAGWIITVIALANPVWEKLPQPVFQTDHARVIVLDLSLSMNSTDLKPSRIERARFKVSDILAKQQEGVVGLVVFAGDAFVVSPLTRDGETISAMLQALKPDIMPSQGSRADLGLLKAGELLKQAARMRGEVLLLADSYTDDRAINAARELRQQGIITSVLGIGAEQGAPLPTGRGDFVRNNENKIITTKLDVPAMKRLASAGGGDYVSLTANREDISLLMAERLETARYRTDDKFNQTNRWKENGPWLVILLLPLAALAFRRGWLLSIALLVITGMPTESAMAFSMNDLWQRQDQQAHKALIDGDIESAVELAQDPLRKGVAEYKRGNYQAALNDFDSASGADAAYNKGNALAKLGKYKEAIDAYEQALEEKANMQDARYNKDVIKKLLQQQQEQQQQSQNSDKDGNQNQDNQQGQQAKQDKQGGQGKGQQSEADRSEGEPQQEEAGQNQTEQGTSDKGDTEQEQGSTSASSQNENKESEQKNAFSDAAEQAAAQAEEDATRSEHAMSGNENRQQEAMTSGQQKHGGEEKEEERHAKSVTEAEQQQRQPDNSGNSAKSPSTAEILSSEEQIAAEQWLRRIPDDPAGLLRRKLRYQYIQRGGQVGNVGEEQAW
jgi:Ca-activated chloride channel family protein